MRELKIGVIGSGGRGGLARHAHGEEKGARVVACCDLSGVFVEVFRCINPAEHKP